MDGTAAALYIDNDGTEHELEAAEYSEMQEFLPSSLGFDSITICRSPKAPTTTLEEHC